MGGKLEELIQNATLEIIDFDIHTRTEMKNIGRSRPFYIMSYIKQGVAEVKFRDKTYITDPETVVLLPPNEPHDHVKISNEDAVFLWWHFNFKIADTIDVLKLFHFPICFKMTNSFAFENVFCQYVDLCRKPTSIPNIILRKAKGMELMAFLVEGGISSDVAKFNDMIPEVFMDILLDIINNHINGFNLKNLADKYHMHPTYISNRFKEYFGVAPIQLQHEMLIEKAKSLLKSNEISIGEVASMLGYNDLSAFSRFFSSKEGVSPSHFKENA